MSTPKTNADFTPDHADTENNEGGVVSNETTDTSTPPTLPLDIVEPAPESPETDSEAHTGSEAPAQHQSTNRLSEQSTESSENNTTADSVVIERTLWGKTVAPAASIFLTIAGVAGMAALLMFAYMTATNQHLLYVETGSMEPTVPTNSLVLAQDLESVSQLEEGMILTVDSPRYDSPLTHRITTINDPEDTQTVIDHNRSVQERADTAGLTASTGAGIEDAYGDTEAEALISYSVLTGPQSLLNDWTRGFLGADDRTAEDFHIHSGSVGNENIAIVRMQGDANSVEDRYPHVVHEQNTMVYRGHISSGGQAIEFLIDHTTTLLVLIAGVVTVSLLPIREFKQVEKPSNQSTREED